MKDANQEGERHLIHSFPRSEEEKVQLALRKYRGRYYMDLRIWFQTEENPTLRPTKKGISLSLEHLPELRKGMERLAKAAEKFHVAEEVAL
jgi:hypothetical protein